MDPILPTGLGLEPSLCLSVKTLTNICDGLMQVKYKDAGKQDGNTCLYSLLPETLETRRAKEAAKLLSEVHRTSEEQLGGEDPL